MSNNSSFLDSLSKFNKDQIEAITCDLLPTIVIAGAGTGKTSTLIQRILFLILEKNIDPSKILVLTFTNKAIHEIKERIGKFGISKMPKIMTCHAFCYEQLRANAVLLDRSPLFRVLNQSESSKMWNILLKEEMGVVTTDTEYAFESGDVQKKVYLSGKIIQKLLHSTNKYESYRDKEAAFVREHDRFYNPITYEEALLLQEKYEIEKKNSNLYDFDDLIVTFNELLKKDELRQKVNLAFEAILIDEFQDVDPVQFEIVKKMTENDQHIFVVGDPDQSIYGFRGAVAKIFNQFEEHFAHNRINTIKLEQNYRSTKEILTVANALINTGDNKFQKNLFTNKEQGNKVVYAYAQKTKQINEWLIKQIRQLVEKKICSLGEIVILFRTNFAILSLEKSLMVNKLPYKLVKTSKFFEKADVKLIVSYLNVILLDDGFSTEAVINTPSRKIGVKMIKNIKQYAQMNSLDFYQAIRTMHQNDLLSAADRQKLTVFFQVLDDLAPIKEMDNFHDMVNHVLKVVDFFIACKLNDPAKRDNFAENVETCVELLTWTAESEGGIKEALRSLSMASTFETDIDDKSQITLSTIHQAKGLEYKCVFIAYLNKGMIPYTRPDTTFDELEEERRVFYVALTRAKDRLFLLSSGKDYSEVHVQLRQFYQSKYIEEIEHFLEVVDVTPRETPFKIWGRKYT